MLRAQLIGRTIGIATALLGAACSSTPSRSVHGSRAEPDAQNAVPPAQSPAVDAGPGPAASAPAAKAPPPITGGTLIVSRNGTRAIAADPDQDRVSIVDLENASLLHTVDLQRGDEPGRLVEDDFGRVHVALRRGGAVATIDIASGEVLARRAVCGAPRGIAYDTATQSLHVACASGELVTLLAWGGGPVRRVRLDVDLRDVIVQPSGLLVSRFKSAELLRLDARGTVVKRIQPHGFNRASHDGLGNPMLDPIEPAVAWRTVAMPNGAVAVVHQYALARPIALDNQDTFVAQSSYGAPPDGCGGLVQTGVSTVGPDDDMHMGSPLIVPPLTVDAAVAPDGEIAMVHAGSAAGAWSLLTTEQMAPAPDGAPCVQPGISQQTSGEAIAIAFNPRGKPRPGQPGAWLVLQVRDPPQLLLYQDPNGSPGAAVSLGGSIVQDTGHLLFHRDSGTGIACAQCHVEGGEDGRVWQFNPIGNRRTQSVNVGLKDTDPFHWDGDQKDFAALVHEVFVRRMGGPEPGPTDVDALAQWIYGLRPPAPIVDPDSPAAKRGRMLFESAATGCSACHAGPKLTNNLSFDVGTEPGRKMQVPSLRGVAYRAPFLHSGCAGTLRDRFAAKCGGGGDVHGRTSQLSAKQIDDLIAYLESL